MATKFEQILAAAEQKKAITPAGANYLEMALNPFPQGEVRAIGYPDGIRGQSVVRVVNQSFSIAAPAGLVGAYDLHVFSFPEACQATFAICSTSQHVIGGGGVVYGWFQSDGVTPVALGLFNIVLVPAGSPTLPPPNIVAPFTLPAGSMAWCTNYTSYCQGPTRVIGGGFKVVSTSPALVAGGGATMYRKSSEATDAILYQTTSSTPGTGTSVRQFTCPPTTHAEATLLPGSVTGEARDGAYVPLIFRGITVPRPCRYNVTTIMPTDVANALNTTFVRVRYAGGTPHPPSTNFTTGGHMSCIKETASDICGVYMTGVPNEATFTVTTRVIIQTFPYVSDPDITLARTSPDNDPVAIDLYQRIVDEMHVAGTAGSNPTGSWWREVCKVGVAASALIPSPMFSGIVASTLPVLAGIADLTLGASSTKAVKQGNGRRPRARA